MKSFFAFVLSFIITATILGISLAPSTAHAADARTYNAGRIIDDGVFTNSDSMTVANIQSFLNSKTVCDTWGEKPSELGGGTRAQWLSSRGIPTPITCLRDYHENPSTGANNYGKAIPAGGISAAQIIYNYSKQFNINPQVLIVTLQKENGLITDEWPTPKQYSESMGFGCPDNVAPGAPACDPNFGSFSAQIYQAARHFRGYLNNTPGWWIPFTTGNNTIAWNPNSSCGGSTVNIQNRSTVALYSYTPYQPNTAAKNAQYGTGDGCSAYGNRNFYLYFTDWFGSTFGGDPVSSSMRLTTPITTSPSQPAAGQSVVVSYTVKNFGSSTISYQSSILQCRMNTTTNCDSAYEGTTSIVPGESRTFTNTITPSQGGNYTVSPFFMSGGIWYKYGTEIATQNSTSYSIPDMRLTSAITTEPTALSAGNEGVVTYKIKNFGTLPIAYETSVLQCRYETSTNCDSEYTGALTINPGTERIFSHKVAINSGGNHTFTPYYRVNGLWYTYSGQSNSITKNIPDLRLTTDILATPTQPIPGQTMTVNYTIRNFGAQPINYDTAIMQCRYDTSTNCDGQYAAITTINPGESQTFSNTVPSVKAGTYKLTPYFLYDNRWFEFSQGVAAANKKTVEVPRYVADMRLTGDITTSPTQPIPGEPVIVTYTVKNFGTSPAYYEDSVFQCRYNTSVNCDSPYTGKLIIDPGDERTFSYTITSYAKSGTYNFTPYYHQNNTWYTYKNTTGGIANKKLVISPHTPDLRLTSDISTTPTQPTPGQTMTVSYTIRNFGAQSINYSTAIMQCRYNTSTNCDGQYAPTTVINPGESQTFTDTVSSVKAGTYRLIPYFLYDNRWFEFSQGAATANKKTVEIR